MKHLFLSLMSLSALLLCSCAKEYIPYEVLQVPKYKSIYTAYTLWYTDPLKMTSENIQTGEIIPFGTEAVITKMTDQEICFNAMGKEFRIELIDRNMETAHLFLKRTFSVKNADELTAGTSAGDFEKMRRGVVTEGMTEEQVLVAYGRPSLFRTPVLTIDTWIYQTGPVKSKRIIFQKKDKESPRTVARIFEL